jgi:hypothetical protein
VLEPRHPDFTDQPVTRLTTERTAPTDLRCEIGNPTNPGTTSRAVSIPAWVTRLLSGSERIRGRPRSRLRRPPPFAKVVPGHQAARVVGLASLSLDPSPTARASPRPRRHLQPSSQPSDGNLLLAAATPGRAAGQRDTGSSSTASGSGTSDRAVQRPSYRPGRLHRATRRGGRWRRGSGRPSPRGPGRRAPPARSRRHPVRPAGPGRRRPGRCPGCRGRPRCP